MPFDRQNMDPHSIRRPSLHHDEMYCTRNGLVRAFVLLRRYDTGVCYMELVESLDFASGMEAFSSDSNGRKLS